MNEEPRNETPQGENCKVGRRCPRPGAGIAIGFAIGVVIGITQDNWAIGIGVGVALAAALEARFKRRRSVGGD